MNLSETALRLDRWSRSVVPVLVTLLLVLIGLTPVPLPYYAVVAPSLPLMAVYYWVVLRPELMPRTAVFVIGLVQDALLGMPLGVNALVLILTHAALTTQRRFLVGKSFWIFWLGFLLVAPAAAFLSWLLMAVLRGALIAPGVTVLNLTLTVVVFPLLAWVFFHTQRTFVGNLG